MLRQLPWSWYVACSNYPYISSPYNSPQWLATDLTAIITHPGGHCVPQDITKDSLYDQHQCDALRPNVLTGYGSPLQLINTGHYGRPMPHFSCSLTIVCHPHHSFYGARCLPWRVRWAGYCVSNCFSDIQSLASLLGEHPADIKEINGLRPAMYVA